MTSAFSRWTPSPGVVTHAGEPVPSNFNFFVAPPLEIGEIYTAYSPWQGDKTGQIGAGSIIKIFLYSLVGVAIGAGLFGAFSGENPVALIAGALLGGGSFAYLLYQGAAQETTVTYTGARGIASYRYNSDSAKREKGNVLLFANAVELRVSQTRNYRNGMYTGTSYSFVWAGSDGKQVYTLGGTYVSETGQPKDGDPFHHARAAETAWSRYLLQFVNAELERTGAFKFNLRGKDFIVARPGLLELHLDGQHVNCTVDEIAKVVMHNGFVTVRRKDAKSGFLGFVSAGVFCFNYSELANGRVFMMLLDQLVGIS
jgi:hypothetical protein